jgi:hypothetical protein
VAEEPSVAGEPPVAAGIGAVAGGVSVAADTGTDGIPASTAGIGAVAGELSVAGGVPVAAGFRFGRRSRVFCFGVHVIYVRLTCFNQLLKDSLCSRVRE